jgi:hypothetical protein
MSKHILAALSLAVLFGVAAQGQAPPPAKNPFQKLVEPWPDAEQMRQRKATAEALRLFGAEDPVAFTLTADFKTINKDRDPKSKKQYPAELSIAGGAGAIPIKLNARGHVRRMSRTCDNVPLKIEFPEDDKVAGTIFDGQDSLKLVVQCRNAGAFEQFLLREYLVYRVMNLITPQSFRARLARVSYIDSAGKPIGEHYGMLLEDDSDVAKRMSGRTVELPRVLFKDLHAETLDTMMLFEYMIGSTDFSIYALHNVVFVQKPDRSLYSVPYDFDMAGLVSAAYAIPDKRLPIQSVKERLYRGPCRTQEQLESALAPFRSQKDRVLALPDTIPDLSKGSANDAKNYLGDFYNAIKDPKDVKRLFVDGCKQTPTM